MSDIHKNLAFPIGEKVVRPLNPPSLLATNPPSPVGFNTGMTNKTKFVVSPEKSVLAEEGGTAANRRGGPPWPLCPPWLSFCRMVTIRTGTGACPYKTNPFAPLSAGLSFLTPLSRGC